MIHQSPIPNEVLHERGDGVRPERFDQGEISDLARIKVDLDLMAFLSLVRRFFTLKKGKANIKGVSIKDPSKGLRYDA